MNTFFVWIEVRLILPKVICVSSRVHTYLLPLPVALHSFSASSSLTVFFSSLFTFYSSPCQCILSYFISFGHSFLFFFYPFFFCSYYPLSHLHFFLPFLSIHCLFLWTCPLPLSLKERKVKGLKAQVQTEIQKAEKAFQCM